MKKILCIVLFLMMLLLSACVWTTTALDPIPDAPVKSDPIPEQDAPPVEEVPEEKPEEIPDQTPPAQTQTPIETDYSALQAEVEAFLQTPGVNGFLCGGGNWPEVPVRLNEVVYQLSDETYSYDEVAAAYEANVGEVFTDLSYISSAKLDELLLRLTGYGLYENGVISSHWSLQDVPYLADLDLYCIQHGDTNYQPMKAQVMDYDEETNLAYVRLTCSLEDMDLFCFIGDEFVTCRAIILELARNETGALLITQIRTEAE